MKWFIISFLVIGAACLFTLSISDMFNPKESKEYRWYKIMVRSFVLLIELAVFTMAIVFTILL